VSAASIFWQADHGNQSVDLNGYGTGPSTIYQDITTEPGKSYLLTFAVSGNPGDPPQITVLEVWLGSTIIDTITYATFTPRQDRFL
jgi:hypothetical protein